MFHFLTCAFCEGRYLSTVGSVRTSFSMLSSKLSLDFRMFFMKAAIGDFDCPNCAMLKVPSLFIFMTAGIEGKTRQASRVSLSGFTTSTICNEVAWTQLCAWNLPLLDDLDETSMRIQGTPAGFEWRCKFSYSEESK